MMQQQMMPQQQMGGTAPLMPQQIQSAGLSSGVGVRPSAWMYPFTGMGHFLTHPALWIYAICPIICGVIATIFALGLVTANYHVQYDWVRRGPCRHPSSAWPKRAC